MFGTKRIFAIIAVAIMLLAGCAKEDEGIRFSALPNTQTPSMNDHVTWEISNFTVKISENKSQADICLTIDGDKVEHRCGCVLFDYGKTGVYGIIDDEITIDGQSFPIVIDMYYVSPKETFSAVTIGAIGDLQFNTWFFGEKTTQINTLSAKYLEN